MVTRAGFCCICCQRHFLDIACDPTDKRYTSNARDMAMAEGIIALAEIANSRGPSPRRTDDQDDDAAYADEGYQYGGGTVGYR